MPLNTRIGWDTVLDTIDPDDLTVSDDSGNASAPLHPDTYDRWSVSDAEVAQWGTDGGVLPTPRLVDYVAIAGVIVAASISVEVWDGSAWVEVVSDGPLDRSVIMYTFAPQLASGIRVTFDDVDRVEIARLHLGAVLRMERKIYGGHSPLPLARDTQKVTGFSRGGQFLGQAIRRMGYESSFSFQHLSKGWYREHFDPFVRHARYMPYFIAWRPDEFADEIGYVWTDDDIRPTNMGQGPGWMQVSWNVRGWADREDIGG